MLSIATALIVASSGVAAVDPIAEPSPGAEAAAASPSEQPTPDAASVAGVTPAAPRILGVTVGERRPRSVRVTWTLDQPATGVVEYGRTTAYGKRTVFEPSLDYTTHIQVLRHLKPNTVYHYRVRSKNGAGVLAMSKDRTFRTRKPPTVPAPTIAPTPSPSGGPSASPTASPTATPRPTASPTATPRPTPTPTPRPTASPTPPAGGAITVPSSIDDSCGSDVGNALNNWVERQADGSTLRFPSGSCYLLDGDTGIQLRGRSGITLDGRGSTFRLRTSGSSNASSAFLVQDSSSIVIRGFTVEGGNSLTATTDAASGINERMSGAVVRAGNRNIELDSIRFERLHGFGVMVNDDGRAGDWPSNVYVHDCYIQGGEMGVAITAGRNLRFVSNTIADSVYIAFDLEPDTAGQGFENVTIRDNIVQRYSWGQGFTGWFVAANPADSVISSTTMAGLTITGNRVEHGAATGSNGNFPGLGGLGIRADKSNLKTDLVISDNWTSDNDTQSSSRAVIWVANVRNLTVTGNTQPIANGARLLSDSGTSGSRTVSGNVTSP